MGFQEAATEQLMPQFAVFFADDAGFGIEMVQALDADHAQDMARAQPSFKIARVAGVIA